MMKRLMVLVLTLCLVLSSSVLAPVAQAESDLTGTLSILSWYNETLSEPLMNAFKAKYPNVTVDYTYAPPVADYVEKLSTLLYSGAAPDVFYMCLENREDLIKGGYVMDLSNERYMTDGTIPESVKTTYGADGKAYTLSVDCWVGGVFYNKDIFAQVGIEGEPQTWQEFLDVCQKLKDAGYVPLLDNMQDAAVNFAAPLFGAETLSANPNFTSEIYAGTKTFAEGWTGPMEMYNQLIEKGYLTSDMVGITSDDIVSQFATGQAAMILSGSWNCGTIDQINPDLNYEVMGIPGTEAGNIYYCGAINVGLCINSAAKNADVAKAFLEFAASPEGLKAQYEGYNGFIIASGFEPDVRPELADAVKAVKEGKFYIPMGEWLSYTESLRLTYLAALQDILIGKATPAEAAARLDAKLAEVSQG